MSSALKKLAHPVQPDGREKRGGATRALLLDATVATVAKFGLEGTTISRLAEISGVARGLISFHFDGKDKLLEAALGMAIARYEASWNKHVAAPACTPSERLHRVVDHDLDFCVREPDILALWWAAWGETRAKSIYSASSSKRDERFGTEVTVMFEEAGATKSEARKSSALVDACLMGFWLQRHLDVKGANVTLFRRAGHDLVNVLVQKAQK